MECESQRQFAIQERTASRSQHRAKKHPVTLGPKHMDTSETPATNNDTLIELTADVVAAYVSNNPVPVGELPGLIADVHAALGRVGNVAETPPALSFFL